MHGWTDGLIGAGRETKGDPFMFYGYFSHFLIDSGWDGDGRRWNENRWDLETREAMR